MKRLSTDILKVAIAVTAAVVICSCASSGSSGANSGDSQSQRAFVVDREKINLINASARSSARNINVIWVNPPRKRVSKKSN